MVATQFVLSLKLGYADAYADLLREKNTIRSLKSTAEVVQANKAIRRSLK